MLKLVIISLALLLFGASCAGCLPKSRILSGGEYYPNGLTVEGEGVYTPGISKRTFDGPHYVVPEDTLHALMEDGL